MKLRHSGLAGLSDPGICALPAVGGGTRTGYGDFDQIDASRTP